jgi:hypothetical protein
LMSCAHIANRRLSRIIGASPYGASRGFEPDGAANELVHNRAAAALPTSGAQDEAFQRRAIIDSGCSGR